VEERLREHLEPRSLLLVLDNFEHLLAAAPSVAALLDASPRLNVLATSREPLHVRAEHEFPVLPLPVPGPGVGGLAVTAERLYAPDTTGDGVAVLRRRDGLLLDTLRVGRRPIAIATAEARPG